MRVLTTEECFICGDIFWIETNAPQPEPDSRFAWAAGDGDPATCTSCGAAGWVSCDAETEAWINYDETEPHNVECYEAYERKYDERKQQMLTERDTQKTE